MENIVRSEKGITLIALVVTVIVLLILASVTIAVALGDNGLINRSKQAKNLEEYEQLRSEIQETIMKKEQQVKIERRDITEEDIREVLSKYGTVIEKDDEVWGVDTSKGEIALEDVWAGASSIISQKYSFDLVILPPEMNDYAIFYSFDEGATWNEMINNELHINSFKKDILIYVIADTGSHRKEIDISTDENDSINAQYIWEENYITEPTVDVTGYVQSDWRCVKITANQNFNETWKIGTQTIGS